MSLQRRLLLYLVVCAPLVWAIALAVSVHQARHEVDELYDAELIRLARQVATTIGPTHAFDVSVLPPPPRDGTAAAGEAEVRDLAVAVWDGQGRLLLADHEGSDVPYLRDASGFRMHSMEGQAWRIYYLQSFDGRRLVAAGQRFGERDDLVYALTLSQVVPWVLVLPALLAVMAWAVRQALEPMRSLTAELAKRVPEDLRPVSAERAPAELKPLVAAMNGLFDRIEAMLQRERRFTADAAHELRTPVAVLRAQWDALRSSATPEQRSAAEEHMGVGLERMTRLVTQMLALARADSAAIPSGTARVHWPAIVAEAMSDCLPLAERRHVELACDWPPAGRPALPLRGDEQALTVLLRNLIDNAIRYGPEGSTVTVVFDADRLTVENLGAPLTASQLQRMGERFHRDGGQAEAGNGLGVSIVQRIAAMHGLSLRYGAMANGQGVRATLLNGAAADHLEGEGMST